MRSHPDREARYLAQHEELAQPYLEGEPFFFGAGARVVASSKVVVETDRLAPAHRVPDKRENALPIPRSLALAKIGEIPIRQQIDNGLRRPVGAHARRSCARRAAESRHQRLEIDPQRGRVGLPTTALSARRCSAADDHRFSRARRSNVFAVRGAQRRFKLLHFSSHIPEILSRTDCRPPRRRAATASWRQSIEYTRVYRPRRSRLTALRHRAKYITMLADSCGGL